METETKQFGGGLRNVRYKHIDSDEYYTPIETVEKIFSKILPYVKEKKIWFPCDHEQSAFVSYAQKLGLNYKNSSDDFRKREDLLSWCDVVVTNPPFTLIPTLCDLIKDKNKDFLLISPYVRMNAVMQRFLNVSFFSLPSSFYRPDNAIERVSVAAANSFHITNGKTLPQYEKLICEYCDETRIPILNNIKNFPHDEIAPNKMYVPLTFAMYETGNWQRVRVIDRPKVNGKYKFRRLLIQKKQTHFI